MFNNLWKSQQFSFKIGMAACAAFLIVGCAEQTVEERAAELRPHVPQVPSIDCEVTEGPNKGKKGKRTEDGWCEGDWGGTECDPRSRCKDVEAIRIDGALEAPDQQVATQ